MPPAEDASPAPRVDVLDVVLAVVLAGLIASTAAAVAIPAWFDRIVAVGINLVLDSIASLVTIAVSVLLWLRYRERQDPSALLQSAAFLVLAIGDTIAVWVAVGHVDAGEAEPALLPGQGPLYLFAVAQMLAAALLVVGIWAALRGATTTRPWLTVATPAAGLLAAMVLIQVFASTLPPLSSGFSGPDFEGIAAGPQPIPVATPLGAFLGIACAGLFLVAATLSRRLYREAGSIGDAYVAVGLLFAGFSQLPFVMSPASFPGLVTGGDVLRVGFDIALLLGIEAEARASLAGLREANVLLVRLRRADADRSALEERARLARALHDGLTQDLWLAKLKVGRLASLPRLEPEAAALSDELRGAIDAGIADAQQVLIALRSGGEPGTSSFGDQLAQYVDGFADRSGLSVEFTRDGELPRLAPRVETELLRIAQEALNNIHRHADATAVQVHAVIEGGRLRLGVADDGRGFDPAAVGDRAFGITGMRERAGLVGGNLTIDSRPDGGTRVWVTVPILGRAPLVDRVAS